MGRAARMSSEDEGKPRKFAAPRGTADILPEDWPYWKYVRDTAERVCALFGYHRIETPTFEHAGVYLRTAGAGTDIVEKEMYVFEDRGGDRLALRPEGTAGVVRALVEDGHLRNGLNVHKGRVTNRAVAEALGYDLAEPKAALAA